MARGAGAGTGADAGRGRGAQTRGTGAGAGAGVGTGAGVGAGRGVRATDRIIKNAGAAGIKMVRRPKRRVIGPRTQEVQRSIMN